MLTYDDVPEIESLYKGLPSYRKGLTYYAQVKRKASELLVLSKQLIAPAELLHSGAIPLKKDFLSFNNPNKEKNSATKSEEFEFDLV